ncbi:MAG: hypothetical protein IJF52_00790 [Clostridia bacterium]|nr:hypothetical protein [Clostridia bacterium]
MNNKKKGSKLIKILILALVLILFAVVFFVLSENFFSQKNTETEQKTITVTVSGTDIYLDGSNKVNLSYLESHLTKTFESGSCTVALINDTKAPADETTYNKVVELLKSFGIEQPTLSLPSTDDEIS